VSASFSSTAEWAREQVRSGRLPAAVVGVVSESGVQMLEAFGSSAERAVKRDDYFELYSVSKPLVGLAAMRSVRAGDLSLEDTLESALQGFSRSRTDTVRLEHLLSHTSGIADIALDDPLELRHALMSARQEFEAGTMTSYSNLAYEGIAAMLEAATGSSVYEHVSRLNSSTIPDGISFDYGVNPHPVHGADEFGLDVEVLRRHRHPAAGAYATAPAILDLGARVLESLREESSPLLASTDLREMLVPRTIGLVDPHPGVLRKEYGLAWNLRPSSVAISPGDSFGHAGLSGTQWWIYPEFGISLVFMTNLIEAENHGVLFDELDITVAADLGLRDRASHHPRVPVVTAAPTAVQVTS
jgi:CubicO group peptidase (beta-lactamase class C family)